MRNNTLLTEISNIVAPPRKKGSFRRKKDILEALREALLEGTIVYVTRKRR